MCFVKYNPNPQNKNVEDCTIRAICKITNRKWEDVYLDLVVQGYELCDLPSSIVTFNVYLKHKGFVKGVLPNTCPECYTLKDFCKDYPKGKYIVSTSSHVVAVEDGRYYDTWRSGNESVIYYWRKEI